MHDEVLRLSRRQAECVDFCLDPQRRLAAVTGQAGTGKTTIIKHIAEQLRSVVVAAPTGKAAKRITEATGIHAVTIHKLLEYGRPRERDVKTGAPIDPTIPRRGRDLPLEQQVVLCDEYSMVNHELNRNLIDALYPRTGRLIMFGDVSQLSPIEQYKLNTNPLSPFAQHLEKEDQKFVLEDVFRQQEGSGILTAAHRIRKGQIPLRSDDFKMRMTDEPVKTLRALIQDLNTQEIDFSKMNNQILTPVKIKWIGTGPLNVMLRNIFNPNGEDAVSLMRYPWDDKRPVTVSVGDKVICTENTYDMRDYSERFTEWLDDGKPAYDSFIPCPDTKSMLNGETGVVIAIYPDTTMEIDFGDRVVEIPFEYEEWSDRNKRFFLQHPQRTIELAYAITTHKAQGSEYDNVVYVINQSISFMLSRENIYTAVTRARKGVHVICDHLSLITSLRVTTDILNKRKENRAKSARQMITDDVKRKLKK
jgi:exodeoxyribonuclease V alpha subunit